MLNANEYAYSIANANANEYEYAYAYAYSYSYSNMRSLILKQLMTSRIYRNGIFNSFSICVFPY